MSHLPSDQAPLPRAYRIVGVRIENPTVRSFLLDGKMEATPGQFVMAWLPGLDEKPFSLSGIDPIALTVMRVGPFTAAMHALAAGDRIWLRGPFGQGFSLCRGTMLLVGGGCGAAPLLYLAQVARQAGRAIHVVLGAHTADDLFFQDRFADLGCTVHLVTEDGSIGKQGTAIDVATSLLNEQSLTVDTLYACGPEAMLAAVRLLARSHHLPGQLSYEAYMRCGIGVCGSCARDGWLVCRDGPVILEEWKIGRLSF